MKKSGLLMFATAVLVGPVLGQTETSPAVARAMSTGRFQKAACNLKGDFRSSSALTYLATADSLHEPDKKASQLNHAVESATTAIKGGNPTPAAWYYLGRAYLMLGDVRGADTALAQAAQLAPDCAVDIKGYRQLAWNVLVTPSSDLLHRQQFDSAIATLRLANLISRDYPQGFYNLGAAFTDTKQYDSAAYYFAQAAQKADSDPRFASTRDDAIFNLASLDQELGRHADAIVQFKKYLANHPDAADAQRSLAISERAVGDTAGANQLQQQLASSGNLSPSELMTLGIQYYQQKKYTEAADAFQKVLAIEPNSHDALFDLANMYFAMNDGAKLVATAKQALTINPLGEDDMKLLAQGYRMQNDTTDLLKAYGDLAALTTSITVSRVVPTDTNVTLTFTATGREAQDASGNTIAPAAVTLVFEFTDSKGNVVATQEQAVPALQPNAKQDFTISASGSGISGWRYHVKK